MTPTELRDLVSQCAETDPAGARQLAVRIPDAWFRCQALAWIARFAPAADVESLAREAWAAAQSAPEPYQVIGAAAWPLRALVEREREETALWLLQDVLRVAPSVHKLINRADALFLVWQAAFPLGPKGRGAVLEPLVEACLGTATAWQAGRILADVVLQLAVVDRSAAERLLERMRGDRYRKQAERRLAAGEWSAPRPFFWAAA
jgi:hypothetical protein